MSKSIQKKIINLFYKWERQNKKKRKDTIDELKALKKLLSGADKLNLHTLGLVIDEQLAAFSIDEVVHHNYGVIHYEKADISFMGIWPYLKQQSAIMLGRLGCKYINYEQDLGIEGLRKAKRSFYPIKMLKKFIIS